MVLRRLRWIEDRLWWHGLLRRSDLTARFGISSQQASQDIGLFQEISPGFAILNPSTKAYERGQIGQPTFAKNAFSWLEEEGSDGDGHVIGLERLTMPARRADPAVMAALIASYENRHALEIVYQSMSSKDPVQRVICAHHVVDTGDRFHVRAWDALRRRFADFVVGRIVSVERHADYPWVDGIADTMWCETTEVVLGPAAGLSLAQRRVVEQDHGMQGGRVVIRVRKALVIYVAERLGVLPEIQGQNSTVRQPQLRCLNARELAPLVPSLD